MPFSIFSTRAVGFEGYTVCVWFVTAPPDALITVHIYHYDLPASSFIIFGHGHKIDISSNDEWIATLRGGQHDPGHIILNNETIWIHYEGMQADNAFHLGIQAIRSNGKQMKINLL